jgi:oxygen-independent coproporphyrinogen-3 oxidase
VYKRQYQAGVDADGISVAKGFLLGAEDRMRAAVIEKLMCELSLSYGEMQEAFGAQARPIVEEARQIARRDWGDLVEGDDTAFRITEAGRPFVRTIAAAFDTYLGAGPARHSAAV